MGLGARLHVGGVFGGESMDVALHTQAGKLARVVEVALRNEFGLCVSGPDKRSLLLPVPGPSISL